MATEFKLPELGDNIAEGQIVTIMIAAGDAVDAEQDILEVETDKAVVPVPINIGGTISELKVNEGDTVQPGQVIAVVEESSNGAATKAAPAPAKAPDPEPVKVEPASGTGTEWEAAPVETPAAPAAPKPVEPSVPAPPAGGDRMPVFASPTVRKLAREIGVDIAGVVGSGPGGRISEDDIKDHARTVGSGNGGGGGTSIPSAGPLPDFAKEGPIERQPMSMIAKKTAEHMARCWATIPHVTLHREVDATDFEAFRQQYKRSVEKAGGKLTPTAMLVKIAVEALKRHPVVNTSYDAAKQELVYKNYYHIGVAADTPRGLVVPVIKDADTKSLADVSIELGDMAGQARAGKLSLEQMQGASFTITNLGGIGCGFFTPIVNHPEVAILGVGTAERRLVEIDGDVQSRLMMPLSLSFDHRVVNGADGAKFLTWIKTAIEQPLGAFIG